MENVKKRLVLQMIYRLAVLLEVFAIIVCIHSIYNTKAKLDIKTVGVYLATVGMIELVFYLKWNNVTTLFVFLFMVLYCAYQFEDNFLGAIISTLLMLIIMGTLQFVFLLPFSGVELQSEQLRMLVVNFLVTIFALWVLPKFKIYKLREVIRRREKFIFFIFLVVVLMILLMTIECKVQEEIYSELFIFTIPLMIILLSLLVKWGITQHEKELVENELTVSKSMQKKYDDLLASVRTREHGFKNHIAALLSIKYTSKSYEELVRQQDSYYGMIRKENRYNQLLFLGESTIAGFLYEKFCQAEEKKVSVTYEINGSFSGAGIPIYHLIEILGILIDNAIEAQSDKMEIRQLKFQFEEEADKYLFRVLNPCVYVSYSEIESWFIKNKSTKGPERGLGLYYVKRLCEEYNASILCRNVECIQVNWIEMALEIKKADKL